MTAVFGAIHASFKSFAQMPDSNGQVGEKARAL